MTGSLLLTERETASPLTAFDTHHATAGPDYVTHARGPFKCNYFIADSHKIDSPHVTKPWC